MILLYGLLISLAGTGPLAARPAQPLSPMPHEFLVGADVSMLRKIEELGGIFRKDGRPTDPISLMKSYGGNCFRLRLFVNPDHKEGVVNDLPYTLALARRIKAADARLLLDLHYSDTWADPAHQIKPAAWAALDFPALEKRVETYTTEVLAAFKAAGVLPDIVQVGNEITPGMLWPDGKLGGKAQGEAQWERFTQLLRAGIRGVKQPLGKSDRVRILIHIDRGGDWPTTRWFFENLTRRAVAFDLIGLSYYPWWHGTLEAVRHNLCETAQRFGKDILIVETAYPYRNAAWWAREPNMVWPVSPEGQSRFLADLIKTVRATPNGHGLGVLYWYPEALPVEGMTIWHGGATALFDEAGNALPALKTLCTEQ
ncbi:MAG TPA: glycosyl hydrolase 53 family protein [Chthonomonadaceae bacterium]|nr:glycosyl hydrolase 53 family protein [Chthonomonadaceae bacterium]